MSRLTTPEERDAYYDTLDEFLTSGAAKQYMKREPETTNYYTRMLDAFEAWLFDQGRHVPTLRGSDTTPGIQALARQLGSPDVRRMLPIDVAQIMTLDEYRTATELCHPVALARFDRVYPALNPQQEAE